MLNRLIVIILACLFVGSADARFPRGGTSNSASINTGGMLLNLSSSRYYQSVNQILNWWATGDQIQIISSVNGTLTGRAVWECPTKCSTPATYIDANGEMITPVPADVISMERGWWTTVPEPTVAYNGTSFTNYANQVWKMKWTGCAAPVWTTINLGVGGAMSGIGSNAATITFGSDPGVTLGNVSTKVTFDATCRANPPKAINIYQNEYAANVAAGQFWNPDWINAVKPFGYIRLMDVMSTNSSGISEMSQLADASFTHFGQQFNAARSYNSNISGGVLTVNNLTDGSNTFQVGQRLVCIGCTTTITIASFGTGTGGTGTYNLTGAGAISVSSQFILGIPVVGQSDNFGTKGGWHPSIACSLANTANVNIEFPMPAAASDQMMTDVANYFKGCLNSGLRVKFSYCNEPFNTAGPFICYRYMAAYNSNTPAVVDYAGYRGAKLFDLAATAFASTTWNGRTNITSRWHGTVSGQAASSAVGESWIAGANAYIATGSAYTLQQLVNQLDTAPYWGLFIGVNAITNVSVSATPTVTADNDFTNGQVVRIFVNGGTMAAVLNGVYATVSAATASNFQINISTVGRTYGGTNNAAIDGATFKLLDESKLRNISTPATYPTQYSYFTQQLSKAALNRTASDASYGTITYGGGLFAQPAVGGVAVSSSILEGLQQNALVAQRNGLDISGYEGGPHGIYTGAVGAMAETANNGAIEHVQFFMMGQSFDAGVVGDSTNTPANVYATVFSQWDSVNGRIPAQFDDLSPQSRYGPWGGLRYLPGDTTNLKWQAILAKNSAGVWVDPTPAPTWTVTRNALDVNFDSGSSTTLTCPVHVTSTGMVVLGITWADSAQTISSVVISGGIGAMTQDAFTVNAWSAAVYSKAGVPSSGSPYTATITLSSAATYRNCHAVVLTGLASSTKLSGTTGNPQKNTTLSVTSGSFIFAAAAANGALTFNTQSTTGVATGTVTQIDLSATQAFGLAYWSPGPTFTTPLFNLVTNAANGMAAATYK